ncbi:MAG: serine/threonine protein kinase [Clostridia bacterium]|nr:serine/threonine protein kinase [Clostridia bacterium]MBQ6906045.1 serine/threonine protein kinase [Clostridia bacterium]
MVEISIVGLLSIMGIPTAITGVFVWMLQKRMTLAEKRSEARERAREENEILMIQNTRAALTLSEATARAVQRIPDAHCNGDMHKALDYAQRVKNAQKDFLTKQGIHALYE